MYYCMKRICLLIGSLPLAGAGWRCKEGVNISWLTSGTGRLHLWLHLWNLQDLAQLFKVHDLRGTMNKISHHENAE